MNKYKKLILSFVCNCMVAGPVLGFIIMCVYFIEKLLDLSRVTEEIICILLFLMLLTIAFFVNRNYYKNEDGEKVGFVWYTIISLAPYLTVCLIFQHIMYIASGI